MDNLRSDCLQPIHVPVKPSRAMGAGAVTAVSVLCAALAMYVTESDAHACGGCFAPPDQITTVDSHRMVISLSPEETVLWDQIVYSGNPQDFVWVLPVPTPEVTIELADPDFFTDLDNQTAPTIQPLSPPPQTFCGSNNGMACGAADVNYAAPEEPHDGVVVYDHEVVGPYQTVTIGAEDPNALFDWLTQNNYGVSPEALPAIEHYTALQNAFVVMRLRPGQGVQAMQPVRVRYPGYMGTFPLKMVVVGARGVLDLSLWVFAEQRYEARNYGTVRINEDELAWDWQENRSNYNDVFAATIERAGSRAWVAEYASDLNNIYLSYPDTDLIRNAIPVPYVTRLRTRILVDHVDQDIELAPSANTENITNFLLAPIDLNRPEDVNCDDGGIYCASNARGGGEALAVTCLIVIGLMVVFRRRRSVSGVAE